MCDTCELCYERASRVRVSYDQYHQLHHDQDHHDADPEEDEQ